MADRKISELPPADEIAGDEEVPVVQAGVTRKATAAQLRQITVAVEPPADPVINQLWVPIAP